jgi:site-specific recombinase XerD
MIKIKLSLFIHRGKRQMKVEFPYSTLVKDTVKNFQGISWSRTHGCFYLPYSRSLFLELYAYLRKYKYFVDYEELTSAKPLPKLRKVEQRISKPELLKGKSITYFKEYKEYLSGLRHSSSTITTYTNFIADFLLFVGKRPLESIDNTMIQRFVERLVIDKGYSISSHRQLISAIKHFGERFTVSGIEVTTLQRPMRQKRLPVVLSQQEVITLLRSTANLKHRMALALIYSAGLRISELLKLRTADIDPERKQIRIHQAKGRKDRYVILAESIVPLLQNYLATYRPSDYLIEGVDGGPYSAQSVRNFLRRSCRKAGIKKHITPHTLRHSYATHLIENGVGLRYVQELLGHAKPETTMIYTHIAKKDLLQIRSPLDDAVLHLLEPDKYPSKASLSGRF